MRLKLTKPSSLSEASKRLIQSIQNEGTVSGSADFITNGKPVSDNVNLGTANAINGNISSTVTSGDTNIRVETKEISDAERLRRNRAAYHSRCSELIKDGYVSQEAIKILNAYREELGLHKDIADYIMNEVKEQTVRKHTVLSNAEKVSLDSIRSAIERNDTIDIQESLKKLHALRKSSEIDEIAQLYFQLKAILEPRQYVTDFNMIHEESYWELFWSYIALISFKSDKAEESLAALTKWENHYPANNQILIQTAGFLMNEREQDARNAFQYIGLGYSAELEPLHFAMSELLDKDWRRGEISDVSPRAKFYVDALFKGIYNKFRSRAKESEAERLREKQEEQQREKEIQHKKETFLLQYEEKEGNLGKALLLSGVTQSQFNDWQHYDADFSLAKDAIDKRIAEKKKAADDKAEEEKRRKTEEANRRALEVLKMNEFKNAYETNDCNLQKTCAELDISRDEIRKWRDSYKSFDDALLYLENEHVKREQEIRRIHRHAIFKKQFPYILILVLLVAGGIGISMQKHENKQKALRMSMELQKQEEIRAEYNEQIKTFNEYFGKIKRTMDGIKELESAMKTLTEIKRIETENATYLKGNESIQLTEDLKKRCDELKAHFIKMRFDDDEFVKREGEQLYNEVEKIRRLL